MNAIRQIVTPDAAGNLPMQVPVELRQRPVEVIVLPIDSDGEVMQAALTGNSAVSNAWKIIRNEQLVGALQQSTATLQQEAAQAGLTPDLLNELLRDDD